MPLALANLSASSSKSLSMLTMTIFAPLPTTGRPIFFFTRFHAARCFGVSGLDRASLCSGVWDSIPAMSRRPARHRSWP